MYSSDHRKRVTRLLIRRALAELLRQKPLSRISVKELCLAAGISRGTFYSHYNDVYQLLDSLKADMLSELDSSLKLPPDGRTDREALRDITERIFRCLRDNADICAFTLGPHGDRDFAARLTSLGRAHYMAMYRQLYPDAAPRALEYHYAFVSGGCIGLLEQWMREGMLTSASDMADMAMDIMARGSGFLSEPRTDGDGGM